MKRGIAFSGGGLRGAYQVGVYKAFRDAHIKIDGFVGTSIGSFNSAMCASGNFKKLYNFWYNADLGAILGLSPKLVYKVNNSENDLEMLNEILNNIKSIVLNKGINTSGLRKELEKFDLEKDLKHSKKDFGLVTVRFNDFKPKYLFKENIPEGKLNDYIIASCFLPIFKFEKMIDDNYYLDGGFHDYIPANSLIEKGYDKVYVVDLRAIGIRRPYIDKKKITIIRPAKKLGKIYNFKKDDIRNYIKMGYYDTIKVLKDYDGKKFIFKKKGYLFYEHLLHNVDKEILKEMQKFFGTKNSKRLVIKAIEFVMTKEKFTYFNIYKVKDVIKRIRYINKDYGVYKFVKNMNV